MPRSHCAGGREVNQFLIAHIGHTTKYSEHITWWKPESCGYTICIDKAGLYTEDEARRICGPTTLCIAVPKAAAQALALPTPYYRLPNGFLAKLYDGGPHAVVPNRKDAWQALIAAKLDCGKHDKPTPRGAKAAAIYLQPAHQGEGRE